MHCVRGYPAGILLPALVRIICVAQSTLVTSAMPTDNLMVSLLELSRLDNKQFTEPPPWFWPSWKSLH